MTNVIVNAIDILGQEIDEGVVRISAAEVQYAGGTLLLPEYHEQELVAGSTTIAGVTPGKVTVSIHWGINRTATFRVFIPDTDEITLAELALQKYDNDPAIVSQVADSAVRAEESAVRAEGVADAFGSLETVTGLAHQGRGRPAPATPYLNIPTPDNNPSVGHPDVIVIEGGWNGYEYWMGYTPYPAEARENPNIACSHDGVNWVVPDGLTNPIAPFSEAVALGYDYWSDTDLVHLPDNRLACYFRGTGQGVKDVIVRKVSSDGVNWGPLEVMFEAPFTSTLSPAIVVEADGTFSMWSVNFLRPSIERLERRTSTDGVNWSAPESCTIPGSALGYTWHVDVVRVGDLYHALVATREGYGLYYRWSRDGITWQGPADYIPRTGYAFDQDGHYRSTLLALPGGKFDIWLTGINAPNGDVFETAQWRVGLLRDVDLRAVIPTGSEGGSADSVWVWSEQFVGTYGNPTQEFVGDVTPAIGFAENAITSASVIFPPPPTEWDSFAVDVLCTAPTGGADALISTRYIPMGEGVQLTPGEEAMTTLSIPSGINVTRIFQVRTLTNQPPRDRGVRVTIARVGVDPADTLEEKFLILGLRLRKLS